MADDFWITTSYFNPCRYVTKKYNFDLFAARLSSIGAKLLVVEMALDSQDFELRGEREVVQVRGSSVLWQKERMLNIAIANLPASCTKVAWLDCDLLFEDDLWVQKTSAALEQIPVVQPFSNCIRLPRGYQSSCGHKEELVAESFAAVFARDRSLARDGLYVQHGHTGFAWAARRDLLDAFGLYDACLTGSADHLMAHVFAGALNSRCIPAMIGAGHAYADHFARWASAVDGVVAGRLGHIEGCVLHLWHGEKSDRRYHERNREFQALAFDPNRHIRRNNDDLWEWAEAPASMRHWSSEMFASRNEDGNREQGN